MTWNGHARRDRLPRDWKKIRAVVLERDPICRRCGTARSTDVDHITPLRDDHRIEALQGLCAPCHRSKTGRDSHANRPPRQRPPAPHPGLI